MIRAFSPGSVTLFFEIVDEHRDPLKIGSRGVGVCVSLGAITSVKEGLELKVYVNGKNMEESIQKSIAKAYHFKGIINTELQLPISQGFGMSAAAALSTSLTIAKLKNSTYLKAAQLAHMVEVKWQSGLGDVATQYEGGFTLRVKEGIPPYGIVDRLFFPQIPITLVIFKEGIDTRDILKNEDMRRKIKKEGHKAMERFLKAPSLENAIKIAREFSLRTYLIGEEGKNFLDECPNAAIAMIGNSAIVFGECKDEIIERYKTYRVGLGDRAKLLT